ncbi:SDR family oxidoreductase [uncultured Chitinophaga sp.]|jgi:Predicted nucleoside-diphosphate-sugar epimerases|uniref:SDR family oxidoreductase n=1 Tax=uncultured Chitinophaga sp. TaxID=339340 RepID=UPI002625CE68|nr:SDR family oxidoreductase [uncultured Chitinophaga sp.]
MKIVVIGGTGLIGSKTVSRLRALGHEVIAASPASGVNTITGEGLAEVMTGTDVVIDLANSPSFEDKAVMEFFETSGRNLLEAERAAGVKHHIALSVVGTSRLRDSGYMRAKAAQEYLIRTSGIPYTIVHSTQFFEFLGGIVKAAGESASIRITSALIQPIASDDVADAMTKVAIGDPRNRIVEIGGPEQFSMAGLVENYLEKTNDNRTVLTDDEAPYFGAILEKDSLIPGPDAHLGKIDFETWFATQPVKV